MFHYDWIFGWNLSIFCRKRKIFCCIFPTNGPSFVSCMHSVNTQWLYRFRCFARQQTTQQLSTCIRHYASWAIDSTTCHRNQLSLPLSLILTHISMWTKATRSIIFHSSPVCRLRYGRYSNFPLFSFFFYYVSPLYERKIRTQPSLYCLNIFISYRWNVFV